MKKENLFVPVFCFFAFSSLFFISNTKAEELSSVETPFNVSSDSPIQSFSGEVNTDGTYSVELKGKSTDWKNTISRSGDWGYNWMYLSGNTVFIGSSLIGNYIFITFDENGNLKSLVNTQNYHGGYHIGSLSVTGQQATNCRFLCEQNNKYAYDISYQNKKDEKYSLIDPQKIYKCEEIKSVFTPRSEWFGALNHVCEGGRGGRQSFTFDLFSPPTNFSSCSDQNNCLATGTEYSLTSTTFGKGIQRIPNDFVSLVQQSLNAGTDSDLNCTGGVCIPTSSGNHFLSLSIPETSYLGSCRGTTQDETVSGKIITTPEVNINTNEIKIPGGTSTFNFNILNRTPLVSVSLSKENANINEEITATCDVIDPDTCSDKIPSVKWTCYNDKNQKVNCYFGKDGLWKEGSITEEIPENKQSSQCRSEVKFKAGAEGAYALVCESSDNDLKIKATGKGVKPVKIGDCGSNCDVVGKKFQFCSVLFDNGSTNKTICGESTETNISAFKSDTIEDTNISKYVWDCKNGEGLKETSGPSTKCLFGVEGNYSPSLKIYYKNGDEPTECFSENNTVKVTKNAKCSVLVRTVGSTEDYKKDIKVLLDQPIEAKIEKECTKDAPTTWITDGISVEKSTNSKSVVKYQTGGIGYVKAKIAETECEGATININEKMKWGN